MLNGTRSLCFAGRRGNPIDQRGEKLLQLSLRFVNRSRRLNLEVSSSILHVLGLSGLSFYSRSSEDASSFIQAVIALHLFLPQTVAGSLNLGYIRATLASPGQLMDRDSPTAFVVFPLFSHFVLLLFSSQQESWCDSQGSESKSCCVSMFF